MRTIFFLFLLWQFCVAAITAEFDVVVIGSSPISLIEALYEYHCGHKVMIVEENSRCGGAWRSIDVCGIPCVDLGGHQMGSDPTIKGFLEEYIGCKLIALDNPHFPFGVNPKDDSNGFYFSRGCYEFIDNILRLITATDIVLQLNTKVESAFVDKERAFITLKAKDTVYTTSKVIVTQASSFKIENITQPNPTKHRFFHLYLLIEDESPWCCTYRCYPFSGVSRLMNLTPFVSLSDTGVQLFILQMYSECSLDQKDDYLEKLKKNKFLGKEARLLCAESFVYEQSCQPLLLEELKPFFEMLNTNHIQDMISYIPKWKEVIPLYR